jgi:hypothetical protein
MIPARQLVSSVDSKSQASNGPLNLRSKCLLLRPGRPPRSPEHRPARPAPPVSLLGHTQLPQHERSVNHQAKSMRKASSGTAPTMPTRAMPTCHSAKDVVTTFSTASRARLRHASAGPQPAQGSRAGDAKCRGVGARDAAGMTTRARASAGNGRGSVRAWGVGLARPSLARGRCRGTRRRRRSAVPATARPVLGRRYAPAGTTVAHSARVRLARPTAPRIVLPVKITVKGAPCGRVATAIGASAAP